ncbi:RNA ligase/cyclic nucleotide phosphodiesterase [Aspergillus karnatakaensis]|uniref:RNA ligase/cyclic nucleotide phosphodiesterase n=1 Tax=Aspergillus karnatakaensis TaxID=1810916 RepID=UPI003CCCEDE5
MEVIPATTPVASAKAATTTTTTDLGLTPAHAREHPLGVPFKFSADGTVQRYPGNTTVCHIPADSPLQPLLHTTYNALNTHPRLSKIIAILPPSSWHMTVVNGVREQECEPGMWPPGLEKKPLAEATEEFAVAARRAGLQLEEQGLAPPYRMRVRRFNPEVVAGIGLEVEGATAEEEKRMRRLRDVLADAMGFRAPNHEVYDFHVSIAYFLRHVEGGDLVEVRRLYRELLEGVEMEGGLEFELGLVEFNTFENMFGFPRLFYLGEP